MADTPARHIANEIDTWTAVCITPDYCKVGKRIIPFDSYAIIDNQSISSPDVKAQGVPVYRIDDMHQGVLADAGRGIHSGTSLGSGYVRFLSGQNNVKANGIEVIRHDNECVINCNAKGEGGARGKVVTDMRFLAPRIDPNRTLDDALQDMNEEIDHWEAQGKKLERQIEEKKSQLDETSALNPFDWPHRSELQSDIDVLKSELKLRDNLTIGLIEQRDSLLDKKFPDSPRLSSSIPRESEQRNRQREDQFASDLGILLVGPPATLGIALDYLGAPPETVQKATQIGFDLAGTASTPMTRGPSTAPAGPQQPAKTIPTKVTSAQLPPKVQGVMVHAVPRGGGGPISFKDGKIVPNGEQGALKIRDSSGNKPIIIKNRNVSRVYNRQSFAEEIANQYKRQLSQLPEGAQQFWRITLKGNTTDKVVDDLINRIVLESGGNISQHQLQIIRSKK